MPVCVAPWISFEVAGFAVGTAATTVGVYVASEVIVAVLPAAFVIVAVAWTVMPFAVPTKSFSGVKVTAPVVGSIV